MAANQTDCCKFEQRSVIKFLVGKKSKPYEIYGRICDVYGEICFNQKFVNESEKHGLTTMSQNGNLERKHTDTQVKKIPGRSGV